MRATRFELIDKGLLVRGSPLDKDISTFIGHEAHHTNAHLEVNYRLYGIGYYNPTRGLRKVLEAVSRNRYVALQTTCVLEHFTATLAKVYFEKLRDLIDTSNRELWDYHALEEIDHHHVALDVANLSDGVSKVWFVPVSLGLLFAVATLYKRNGGTFDLKLIKLFLDRRFLDYKTTSAEIGEYVWV